MTKVSVLLACIFVIICQEVAGSCRGCVELDSLTFDKVIGNFKYSIIKFDVPYPYGPKHEAFEEFAKDVADQSDLVVGEVGIKDYGDKENEDLGLKYGVKQADLPQMLLFRQNDLENPIKFDGKWFLSI